MEMNREKAVAYLNRKKKDVNDNEVEKVMKHGRCYGDPIAECY